MNFVSFWIKKTINFKKNFLSCFVVISLSFALVICALIFSRSMILGMQNRIVNLLSGHISVYTNEDIPKFSKVRPDKVVEGLCMLFGKDNSVSVQVKGVSDTYLSSREQYIDVENVHTSDTNQTFSKGYIISRNIADKLNVNIGDKIAMLIVPDTEGKVIRPDVGTVTGIYYSGYSEIDDNLVFTEYHNAQRMFPNANSVHHELILEKYTTSSLEQLKSELNNYKKLDWMQINRDLYTNYISSNQAIFLILFLVIIVSGYFALFVTQQIIYENRKNLLICKILGLSDKNCKLAILGLVFLIVCIACVFGLILGIVLGYNLTNIIKFFNGTEAMKNYLLTFDIYVPWVYVSVMFIVQVLLAMLFSLIEVRSSQGVLLKLSLQ